jgi:hypothetical protein
LKCPTNLLPPKAGNREQSEEDAQMVKALVRSYMQNSRSIILAAVSAKSDFALQKVTKYARKLEPSALRTLGLHHQADGKISLTYHVIPQRG